MAVQRMGVPGYKQGFTQLARKVLRPMEAKWKREEVFQCGTLTWPVGCFKSPEAEKVTSAGAVRGVVVGTDVVLSCPFTNMLDLQRVVAPLSRPTSQDRTKNISVYTENRMVVVHLHVDQFGIMT